MKEIYIEKEDLIELIKKKHHDTFDEELNLKYIKIYGKSSGTIFQENIEDDRTYIKLSYELLSS